MYLPLVFIVGFLFGGQKFDSNKLEFAKRGDEYRIWLFFTDKNNSSLHHITEKAKDRRNKVKKAEKSVWYDQNVSDEYVNHLKRLGFRILNKSRWLNAVAINCQYKDFDILNSLTYIEKIEPVMLAKKKKYEKLSKSEENNRTFLYGGSQDQMEQINAINAHNLGYYGQGVRILYIDTGFDLSHEAFDSIRVINQFDFINNDSITANQTEEEFQNNQDEHGSICLSVLSGFKEGQLIGPAFKSEYLLAKTEIVDQEIQQEEDNYIAALEWGESLGADIACASLGYLDWYNYEDLDGNTAQTTIAVDIASSLGVLCVNSAGNSGNNDWYYIITPADADSVLSVGSVDANGVISSFSSHGPTYDGRIKPEICAMGSSTFCIRPGTDSEYRTASGTSLSAPLAAGAAAIVLSANLQWSGMEVREAIIETASMAELPNNDYGYGIINTINAIDYDNQLKLNEIDYLPTNFDFSIFPNPFNSSIKIHISGDKINFLEISIFNINGVLIKNIHKNNFLESSFLLDWDSMKNGSGVYFLRINADNTIIHKKISYIK